METHTDPDLFRDALKAKATRRIRELIGADQLHSDIRQIRARAKYEKQKPVDHRIVNKELKKVLTPEIVHEVKKAITNPSDKETANRLRDLGEGLESLLDRLSKPKSSKKNTRKLG